jgi:hypothetical protein
MGATIVKPRSEYTYREWHRYKALSRIGACLEARAHCRHAFPTLELTGRHLSFLLGGKTSLQIQMTHMSTRSFLASFIRRFLFVHAVLQLWQEQPPGSQLLRLRGEFSSRPLTTFSASLSPNLFSFIHISLTLKQSPAPCCTSLSLFSSWRSLVSRKVVPLTVLSPSQIPSHHKSVLSLPCTMLS